MDSPHTHPSSPPSSPSSSSLVPRRGRPAGVVAVRTGLVCGFLAGVLLVLVAARWPPLMSLDHSVADALHGRAVAEPGAVRVNRVLTDWVWDPWTMRALIAVAFIVLWWHGARLLAVWVAATSALTSLVQQGMKAAVGRERPRWTDPVDSAHYASFPSGHVLTAMVTCGLLVWLLHMYGARPALLRAVETAAVISVIGVGFTRLYLGVHWLSDVLGGLLLGVTAVAFSAAGYAVLSRRS